MELKEIGNNLYSVDEWHSIPLIFQYEFKYSVKYLAVSEKSINFADITKYLKKITAESAVSITLATIIEYVIDKIDIRFIL